MVVQARWLQHPSTGRRGEMSIYYLLRPFFHLKQKKNFSNFWWSHLGMIRNKSILKLITDKDNRILTKNKDQIRQWDWSQVQASPEHEAGD